MTFFNGPGQGDLRTWAANTARKLQQLSRQLGDKLDLPVKDTSGRTILNNQGVYAYSGGRTVVQPNQVSIDTSDLVDTAVTLQKLQDGSVDKNKVKTGEEIISQSAQLGNAIVISAKIGDAEIVEAKIKDLAVTDAKVNDLAVNKLTAGTIGVSGIQIGGQDFQIDGSTDPGTLTVSDGGVDIVEIGRHADGDVGIIVRDSGGTRVFEVAGFTEFFNADYITTGTLDASQATITNIDASNITTGTLDAATVDAGTITTGTLDASQATITNIDASNITTGTLSSATVDAGAITTGTLDSATIDAGTLTVGTLDFDAISRSGLSVIQSELASDAVSSSAGNVADLSLADVTTGTLTAGSVDAAQASVINLDAGNITTGTMTAGTIDAGQADVININADNITAGTITSRTFQTDTSGNDRVEIQRIDNRIQIYDNNDNIIVEQGGNASLGLVQLIPTDTGQTGIYVEQLDNLPYRAVGSSGAACYFAENGGMVAEDNIAATTGDVKAGASGINDSAPAIQMTQDGNLQFDGGSALFLDGNDDLRFGADQFAGGDVVFQMDSSATMIVQGNLDVKGSSKNFRIPHPTKEDTDLLHASAEGPTANLIYRWRVDVGPGKRKTVDLPDYWRHINKGPQVWVSPVQHFGRAYGEVNQAGTKLTVVADQEGGYDVLLLAERNDETARKGRRPVEVDRGPPNQAGPKERPARDVSLEEKLGYTEKGVGFTKSKRSSDRSPSGSDTL